MGLRTIRRNIEKEKNKGLRENATSSIAEEWFKQIVYEM